MTLIEKTENAIKRSHNLKFNGAIFVETVAGNDDKCRVYDMNYSTFSKKLVGIDYVSVDTFFKI